MKRRNLLGRLAPRPLRTVFPTGAVQYSKVGTLVITASHLRTAGTFYHFSPFPFVCPGSLLILNLILTYILHVTQDLIVLPPSALLSAPF